MSWIEAIPDWQEDNELVRWYNECLYYKEEYNV
jgi:hypothetical protein